MLTRSRSQTQYNKKSLYEVNIDFDEASEAWKSNKKSNGNGTYVYICMETTKKGNKCARKPLSGAEFCKIHQQCKTFEAIKL